MILLCASFLQVRVPSCGNVQEQRYLELYRCFSELEFTLSSSAKLNTFSHRFIFVLLGLVNFIALVIGKGWIMVVSHQGYKTVFLNNSDFFFFSNMVVEGSEVLQELPRVSQNNGFRLKKVLDISSSTYKRNIYLDYQTPHWAKHSETYSCLSTNCLHFIITELRAPTQVSCKIITQNIDDTRKKAG